MSIEDRCENLDYSICALSSLAERQEFKLDYVQKFDTLIPIIRANIDETLHVDPEDLIPEQKDLLNSFMSFLRSAFSLRKRNPEVKELYQMVF